MSTLNIAHRGASADAPENTLAAFRLALEQGADMIETDLQLTRDGVLVLRHDFSLRGAWLGELTLDELRARDRTIPTLDETLKEFGVEIPFNLELKWDPARPYVGMEARVLDCVRRYGLLAKTLFSCFEVEVLACLRELAPEARLGQLVDRPIDIAARAKRVGAEAVHLPLRATTRERVATLHDQGWRVHVYTVDRKQDLERMLAWEVDGIFTNVPGRLGAILAAAQ